MAALFPSSYVLYPAYPGPRAKIETKWKTMEEACWICQGSYISRSELFIIRNLVLLVLISDPRRGETQHKDEWWARYVS